MITKKIPSRASYLSNCDLINKYTLPSAYQAPLLSTIFLELSPSNILNVFEKTNQSDSTSEIKIELFLILYVFKLFQPTIRNESYNRSEEVSKDFLLRISFSKEKELHRFSTILFVENWSKSIFQEVSSHNKKFSSFKITAETFFNVEKFLAINNLEFNPEKLTLNCKFVFENYNFKNRVISIKLIKNIVPFWISC